MKHDRTDPCPQCPFRKASAAGWLGSYTPESVIEAIQREHPFPCHPTVDYGDPNWRDTIFAADSKVQACAGFLILMRKLAKLPRDPELFEHSKRVDRNHPEVFATHFDFVKHHTSCDRR